MCASRQNGARAARETRRPAASQPRPEALSREGERNAGEKLRTTAGRILRAAAAAATFAAAALPAGLLILSILSGSSPSALFWCEAAGLAALGVLALFILRCGPRVKSLAAAVLVSVLGLFMSIRHGFPFWTGDIGTGEGPALLGIHAYSWAAAAYSCAAVTSAASLLILSIAERAVGPAGEPGCLSIPGKAAMALSFALVAAAAVLALCMNCIPPYAAKDPPGRFTPDIKAMRQGWSAAVWKNLAGPMGMGGLEVEPPFIAGVSEPSGVKLGLDPSRSPITTLGFLIPTGKSRISFPEIAARTKFPIAAAALSPSGNEFAFLTQELGVFFADRGLRRITGFAVLDGKNGADMALAAGAAFAGRRLIAAGSNKTLCGVVRTEEEAVREKVFLETRGTFRSVFPAGKKVLSSVRGRMSYVGSLASDGKFLYTVTLPNRLAKFAVLQKYDVSDWTLSSEAVIRPDENLRMEGRRALSGIYVSGLAVHNEKILAMNARHNELLIIDPDTARVVRASSLRGLSSPRSIIVRKGKLLVLDRDDEGDTLVEFPLPEF